MTLTHYVVTFDPRPVIGPGALDGLKRMPLADARKLKSDAALIPKWGHIIDTNTLTEVQ